MPYINKPTHQPHSHEERTAIRNQIHSVLLAATETGSELIKCSGASFVTSSMGIWMEELAELDGKSTAKFLAALSVLANPSASHTMKLAAEKKRYSAVINLMQAVNLDMSLDGKPKH